MQISISQPQGVELNRREYFIGAQNKVGLQAEVKTIKIQGEMKCVFMEVEGKSWTT